MKKNKIFIFIGITFFIFIVGMIIANNKATQELIQDAASGVLPSSAMPVSNVTPFPIHTITASSPNTTNVAKDPQNATYIIEGTNVTLANGSAKINGQSVQMFGSPTVGDLTGDNANDAGVILVVSGSGSEIYYYAAAALNNTSTYTYEGTNAILLGDRIAPQANTITNQTYIVNYADRNEGESITVQPSVGMSKYFVVQNNRLVETTNN